MPPGERAGKLPALIKNYYRTSRGGRECRAVLDLLDRQDLSRRTRSCYTSDNGFFLGEHGLFAWPDVRAVDPRSYAGFAIFSRYRQAR